MYCRLISSPKKQTNQILNDETCEHCDVKKINKQIGFNRARLKVKEKLLFLYVILKLYVNNFLVFGK